MRTRRTSEPFGTALPKILAERGMSLTALAGTLGVSQSHLSRIVRAKDYKTPSPALMARIDEALGLPAGYFPEEREAAVIARVKSDPQLRDRLYRSLTRGPS